MTSAERHSSHGHMQGTAYACYAYDIEHPPSGRMSEGIHYEHADLHDEATVQKIIARHKGRVRILSAFPVCTDLARERSGVVGTQAVSATLSFNIRRRNTS